MMTSSLTHTPDGAWRFDSQVASCFTDMLERSIPGYSLMRMLVTQLGHDFLRAGSLILDLGCSNGLGLEPFVRRWGPTCDYLAVDTSPDMIALAHERFDHYRWSDVYGDCKEVQSIEIVEGYLESVLPPKRPAQLILCVLTSMFTPIDTRAQLFHSIYASLAPGGALLIVDKLLASHHSMQNTLTGLYHDFKLAQGYSAPAIQAKKRALRGVLVPVPAQTQERWLHDAGFAVVECFFRAYMFAGYCCVK